MPGKCVETEHHVMVRLIVLVIDEEKENTWKRVCCHCIVGQIWGSDLSGIQMAKVCPIIQWSVNKPCTDYLNKGLFSRS